MDEKTHFADESFESIERERKGDCCEKGCEIAIGRLSHLISFHSFVHCVKKVITLAR